MYVTSQKQVATWLPVKNKSKIWSIEMADECSFWAERHSMAIIRDVILVHTDCKEMDLCPIRDALTLIDCNSDMLQFW